MNNHPFSYYIGVIIGIVLLLALIYGFFSVLSMIVCFGFNLDWSWRIGVGFMGVSGILWLMFNLVNLRRS